jgi:hypothetical protein
VLTGDTLIVGTQSARFLASDGLTRGTISTNKEHTEHLQGHFEYHAGTGALTWALLVLTDGTLSTHMDTVNDRIRYSEYFHAVLRVPVWGALDARMHNAE